MNPSSQQQELPKTTEELASFIVEYEFTNPEARWKSHKELAEYYAQLVHSLMQAGVNENTSDGYHTFKELYRYRMLYNAALFNEWGKNKTVPVVKSKRHSDGELCFGGGWFVVVAELPNGQISNHYEMKDWDVFNITEYDKVPWEFDGHTPEDVEKRLTQYLKGEL